MKQTISIILIIIFSVSILYSGENPQFRLGWTVQNSPWFYESFYSMNGISFNTAIILGLDFDWFMIDIEPFCDYMSLNGREPLRLFQGASINFGTTIDTFFKPIPWMEIKLGAGGFLQRSVFQYDNSGWLGLNRWGITGVCDFRFIPWEWLDFVLKNRFDMIFAFDGNGLPGAVLPNYTSGLRINVYPGLRWLGIFVEANAFYWDYTSELRSIQSWMFQAQVGLSLDFRFPGKKGDESIKNNKEMTIISEKDIALIDDEKTTVKKDPATEEKKPEKNEPGLIVLGRLQPGVEAAFTTIVFEKGTDTLIPGSTSVLDKVADILVTGKKINISIEAYAEYSGNPLLDLELIKSRAEMIRSYFLRKGVEEYRIKVRSMGQIINDDDTNAEKAKVIIKILSN